MRFSAKVLLFFFVLFHASSYAALIEYEFDTLTFSDDHQISGAFTYDTFELRLVALSISLFGPLYNIDFDIDDLTAPDAFSVDFDNSIFGDTADEGFQLSRDDVEVVTGQYGLGDNDTCYFDPQTCTRSLFTMTQVGNYQVVAAPQPTYLLILGLVLLGGRRLVKKH